MCCCRSHAARSGERGKLAEPCPNKSNRPLNAAGKSWSRGPSGGEPVWVGTKCLVLTAASRAVHPDVLLPVAAPGKAQLLKAPSWRENRAEKAQPANSRRVSFSSPCVWVFQTTGRAVGFRASAAGFEHPFLRNIYFYFFLLAKPRLIFENTFMAQHPGRVMFPLCQDSNSSRITGCFCTGVCAQRPPLLLCCQTLPVASPVPQPPHTVTAAGHWSGGCTVRRVLGVLSQHR